MAGTVEAVGDGVRRFAPGDRVINTFWNGWIDHHWPAHAVPAMSEPGVNGSASGMPMPSSVISRSR
ncbi:alcohol dehydrogenase catalytic domain-containing protein [Variovorax sp. CT11-76]